MKVACRVVDPDSYVSTRGASELIGCSTITLWRLLKRPDFPRPLRFTPENPRSQLRWSRRKLLAWAAEQERRTAEVSDSSEQRGLRNAACSAE